MCAFTAKQLETIVLELAEHEVFNGINVTRLPRPSWSGDAKVRIAVSPKLLQLLLEASELRECFNEPDEVPVFTVSKLERLGVYLEPVFATTEVDAVVLRDVATLMARRVEREYWDFDERDDGGD